MATGGAAPATLQRESSEHAGDLPLEPSGDTAFVFPGPGAGGTLPVPQPNGATGRLPALQRQAAPPAGGAGDDATAAQAPAGGGPAPGATPAGGGGQGGDSDLDDLAGRLYDRIRDQLRAELTIDRERAGLLNDLGLR